MEITIEQLEIAVQNAGLELDAIYPDYSGRAMYGRTCYGVVLHATDQAHLWIALADTLGPDQAYEMANLARTDDMGLSTILYWPGVTVTSDRETVA